MKKIAVVVLSLAVMTGSLFAKGNLKVKFGQNGKTFTMVTLDNPTANQIVHDVGNQSWNLPIYDFDNYNGWEYFQYYDISRRYKYESSPVKVTEAKAGEVYYSHPNRIILFYHDAKVNMQLTKIGDIQATPEFIKAVEDNPALEYWGNKLVTISK
ncbi:MAG: hypothetical protein MJ188_12235 [Treponema sp.]|nr:hypothetical protein [Treponema sp.]